MPFKEVPGLLVHGRIFNDAASFLGIDGRRPLCRSPERRPVFADIWAVAVIVRLHCFGGFTGRAGFDVCGHHMERRHAP
jgi:hypothetical protein